MRKFTLLIAAGIFLTSLNACSEGGVEEKKEELKELEAQKKEIENKISELTEEIAMEDSTFNNKENTNVVQITTLDMNPVDFSHRIEVRGEVESRRNVVLSAETNGRIDRINIKEGDKVSRGQKLIELDASIVRNNIAELQTNLELAETVYKRQENLWNQKIGTEIQYLEAKNNYEALKSRLNSLYSQLDMAMVKAPFSGRVDEIPARQGEMASPGMPLLRLISPGDMYIKADVSERYIGRFEDGDSVMVRFPAINKDVSTTISNVSDVINKANRTFTVEVNMPNTDFTTKPNQVAVLSITDYTTEGALTVPTRLIQRDNEGTFVYRVKKNDSDMMAEKVHIETGTSYQGDTEVTSGLNKGDTVINKGSRDVADGV
ncbi:MAG: efflux RND transporter periplasmic adaptor subunit, partial [Cyclobacteriaceae bacterium]